MSTTISNRQLFLSHIAQTTTAPLGLEIERGEGSYLYSPEGKKYLDLISGISVSNVGHCHPKVVAAIKKQAETYMHLMVYGEYIQSPQVDLATAMIETLPKTLDNIYFVNSGSEAIEGAMKLAKRFTARTEIISCENAYHGSTHGALSIQGSEFFKTAFRPLLPDCKRIRFNNTQDLEQITTQTAAIVVECVQGEAGIRPADKQWMLALRERCDETGTLLIIDEVQTGFGRTGTFWAFEDYAIVPDVVVCAKGMGGGMPIGAFIASEKIMSTLKDKPFLGHITTFGGHPVSCAASLACLKAIQEENLLEGIDKKSALFKQLLVHNKIKEVRAKGLMIAVEVKDYDYLQKLIQALLEKGIISDWFLFCNNSMRIAPPLIITPEEIQWVCEQILSVLEEVE